MHLSKNLLPMFHKLAAQLPYHMKESKVPGGIQTHSGEGHLIRSQ